LAGTNALTIPPADWLAVSEHVASVIAFMETHVHGHAIAIATVVTKVRFISILSLVVDEFRCR
jgi:hypothetical protein